MIKLFPNGSLAHILVVIVEAIQGHPVGWMFHFGEKPPDGFGYSLPGVYMFWAITVGLMYLPSLWFSRMKQRSRKAESKVATPT